MKPLAPFFALALIGCGGNSERSDDTPVTVSVIGEASLRGDPNSGALSTPQRVYLGATAQGLVRFDAAGQIEPALAERWIVIDDGRSFIFRLRNAEWSDGSRVTATQVVAALRRAIAPSTKNGLSPFIAVIDEIVEMTPSVIEVRLRSPRPDLLKLFAQPELSILAPNGKGSGPFRTMPSNKAGMVLEPVPFERELENLDVAPEHTVSVRGEPTARALARFGAGRSDLILGGTFADWPLVTAAAIAPANIKIDSATGLFGLVVTRREGLLATAAGRMVLSMAIDRKAITQSLNPNWKPVDTMLPEQLDSAAPPATVGWAAQSLEERRAAARTYVANYQRGRATPILLRIALPDGPGSKLLWAHLQVSFAAIGVQAERVSMDSTADLRLIDAVAPYDSGRWFVATACAPCGVQDRVDAARDAKNLPDRAAQIAAADAALTADAAFIPIAQPMRWSVVAMRLKTWQDNPRAWHPLNHLRTTAR